MKEVAIIADSVATISPEVAREYDILLAPFHIKMDGKDYIETKIYRNQLYSRLRGKDNLLTTSPPSPGEFLELYNQASQQARAILIIILTSGFSQAYNSALKAKNLAAKQLPNTTVEVFDSPYVVGGQMFTTIDAAKAAREGKSLP